MKIKEKNRKIDIQNIFISKSQYGTDIMLIINDKVHKLNTSAIYADVILNLINEYLEGVEYE